MILGLYRALSTLGGPLIRVYLSQRLRSGKEDSDRFGERLGIADRPRPDGPLVWLHAASVGESLSLLPLIDAIRDRHPGHGVLVTTGTVTSATLMRERLPDGVLHQFIPVDRVSYVRRFLDHWRPNLALWAESEFWPNLLMETARRGVPMVLINGRVSDRSFRTWQRFPGFIRTLLGAFDVCLGQTDEDASRLLALGARAAVCHGNLKYAAPPLPASARDLQTLAEQIGDRPLWLAASTHPGEEELAGRVHRTLATTHPRLLTIVVPRHPARGGGVTVALAADGLRIARRAAGDPVTAETDVYIADTLGEMGLFYRLSPIVFIGKTLTAHGGQNPIEPAKLNCTLVHGPHMENFPLVTRHLREHSAAVEVADEAALADAVGMLLDDPAKRARMAEAAQTVAALEADSVSRVMDALALYFETEPPHAAP